MQYIDEKFKEESPEKTVNKIITILSDLGIELEENWHDSGIENCWSLTCHIKGMQQPSSNGKGITKEFARASAYGEFMERLQSGLFFYKYQSIEADDALNLHTYAPDKKYMTVKELIENGEWMDYLIESYGNGLTREKIAQQCKMYACTQEDKILTIPFYNLFEDKYVYMPAGFAEHMYSANGCCVGNTKAEAWVHALSEIMERKGNIATLINGESAPEIPEEVLQKFPTVQKILKKIRSYPNLDVKIFDFSCGYGIPVISTRIINKDTQTYLVNTGADPILEIAIQRTLTEIMQGRNIETVTANGCAQILSKITDFPVAHNVLNLLETGNGMFAVDFFAEELTCKKKCTEFEDHSGKTNDELLSDVLDYYKKLNKPVLIRNYSFLGFPCYKFIVPGFSESRSFRLNETLQEYALADIAAKVFKNPIKASDNDLSILLMFYKKIQTVLNHRNNFAMLAGIPLNWSTGLHYLLPTLSYASYRLGNYNEAIRYIEQFLQFKFLDNNKKQYFACIKMYLKFKATKIDEEKIRVILNKFFNKEIVETLYESLGTDQTPYDRYLLNCDPSNCGGCANKSNCTYTECKNMLYAAGQKYGEFAEGQNKAQFTY
ncbi:MAG: YcaO-like family protein [Oscillospiraceae bacterium]|nr:YcaO-like family protein [Oscillospiraceae bacterium]